MDVKKHLCDKNQRKSTNWKKKYYEVQKLRFHFRNGNTCYKRFMYFINALSCPCFMYLLIFVILFIFGVESITPGKENKNLKEFKKKTC